MNELRETVSVIVPAYNVEPYIRQCILSIVNQTYQVLEILVVNDGSSDGTGRILDELSCTHKQVRVIHQKNRGVSAARNRGLDVASGTHVLFVDGDDYITPDCVEYMLELIHQTGGDFCFSKCCFSKAEECQTETVTAQIATAEQAVAVLLSPDVFVGCWNKLYRRDFLKENNIRFSEELFYGEGLLFIIACAQIAKRVGIGNRKVYYYRRNNMNSATTKFDVNKIYNGEKSLKHIEAHIDLNNRRIRNMYYLHLCTFYLGALVRLQTYNVHKVYAMDYKHWLKCIRKYTPMLICSGDIRPYRALMLATGCVSPGVIAKIDEARRKYIVKSSIR